jgi:cystathionine beta-lyase family protein involved in aluminum resistance
LFEYDNKFWKLARDVEEACAPQFRSVDEIFEKNQIRVVEAFIKNRVSERHLFGTTGYGYDDAGRAIIDKVYTDVMGSESALVRHNFVSGTHALAVCLFAILRPGDELVCVTEDPYDSLKKVIGTGGYKGGSLADFGVRYSQVNFLDGAPDYEGIAKKCRDARLVYIQRSRGYSSRGSLSVTQTEEIIKKIRESSKEAAVVVDNCYCEFVSERESTTADLIVGSLIKNPGGGLARTGGYIAGKKDLVALCANRLTAPGIGAQVGCSLEQNREILMGLFMAPQAVANALKTAIFCASLFEKLGFSVSPGSLDTRVDIVQSIKLGSKEKMRTFCVGVQAASPIDSFVKPQEWDMPGYEAKVIMAAGNFTMGATIESSADGPMREPYTIYYQGGLNFPSGKLCVMEAAWRLTRSGLTGEP